MLGGAQRGTRGIMARAHDGAKAPHVCCQTNANSSQCLQRDLPLGGAKLPPLGESGGSVSFEVIALGDAAILVEVV